MTVDRELRADTRQQHGSDHVDYSDALLTMAELAVALAGFASLVSAIGRRGDEGSRAVDLFRLRTMVEMALRYAALAIVPVPFLHGALSDAGIWRVSSGLYLISTALYSVLTLRRMRSLDGLDFVSDRWVQVSTIGLSTVSSFINLVNVFGWGGSDAASLYLAALVLGLVTAGLLFLSVAASVFRGPEA
jgi:hypothetical protein